MGKLTQTQKVFIANNLVNSCKSTFDLVDNFPGCDESDIGLGAEDCGVWNCETCNWWVDQNDLHENYHEIICKDCYNEIN